MGDVHHVSWHSKFMILRCHGFNKGIRCWRILERIRSDFLIIINYCMYVFNCHLMCIINNIS